MKIPFCRFPWRVLWSYWAQTCVMKCVSWKHSAGFDASVVLGGYEESISAINSHGRAAAARLRGNGGSGSASALTSPLSTWTVWGATSSPGTGPCPALIKLQLFCISHWSISYLSLTKLCPKTICYIRALWRQLFCVSEEQSMCWIQGCFKPANNNSPFLILIWFEYNQAFTIIMQLLLNMKKGNTFFKEPTV